MSQATQSSMRTIDVGKVVLNIGLGKSGEAIERGKKVLQEITGQQPSQRRAKRAVRDWGVRKGEPIGVLVTIRGKQTHELISRLLAAREKKLQSSCFDERGSVSFGIKEHIEIPGIRYDPAIGILGMNVSVVLQRPGYRVTRRARKTSKVGKAHLISKDEAMDFFKTQFGAIVI
jgi:large subunit ribosomal protein L5